MLRDMDLSALPPLAALRQSIVRSIEETGGRHDEPEIYSASPGDPGLTGDVQTRRLIRRRYGCMLDGGIAAAGIA